MRSFRNVQCLKLKNKNERRSLRDLSFTLESYKLYPISYNGFHKLYNSSVGEAGVLIKDGGSIIGGVVSAGTSILHTMTNTALTFTSQLNSGSLLGEQGNIGPDWNMSDEGYVILCGPSQPNVILGTIGKVRVKLYRYGSGATGNIRLGLRTDINPSTTPEFVSDTVYSIGSISTGGGTVCDFYFDTPPNFTAGDYFTIVIYYENASDVDTSNYIAVSYLQVSGYYLQAYDGSAWGSSYYNQYALYFQAYGADDVILQNTAVTIEECTGWNEATLW